MPTLTCVYVLVYKFPHYMAPSYLMTELLARAKLCYRNGIIVICPCIKC